MEETGQARLHGFWASTYVHKVIWALKLKGVKYEYIEEDLSNKSPALVEYNPVHKKVRVLVHGGKPVAESAVILEYIEETWPDQTPYSLEILMREPWLVSGSISDNERQGLTFSAFYLSSEEDKEKTATQVVETLKIIQDKALGHKKFFGGNTLSLVDLSFGWLAHWFGAIEEVVGVHVLEPTTLPTLHQWTLDFKQESVIKENLPDSAAVLEHCKRQKKRFTSPTNN